jgi:hypothetical protein
MLQDGFFASLRFALNDQEKGKMLQDGSFASLRSLRMTEREGIFVLPEVSVH